jgi:hypothetical protein
MTTERIKGCIAFYCDLPGCTESVETGEREFNEASASVKADGWCFRKRGAVWKHFCHYTHEEKDFRGQKLV